MTFTKIYKHYVDGRYITKQRDQDSVTQIIREFLMTHIKKKIESKSTAYFYQNKTILILSYL